MAGTLLEPDLELTSPSNQNRNRRTDVVRGSVDQRTRHNPGATSQRLVFHAALIGPDRDPLRTLNFTEIHVCPGRCEHRMSSNRGADPIHLDETDPAHRDHDMWDAAVHEMRTDLLAPKLDRDIPAQVTRVAHLKLDQLAFELRPNHAGRCFERNAPLRPGDS